MRRLALLVAILAIVAVGAQADDKTEVTIGKPARPDAIVYAAGPILYQYQDVDFGNASYDYGITATVGVEWYGGNTTWGLQYSYNTAAIQNSLAILVTTGPVPVTVQSFSVEERSPASGGTGQSDHHLPWPCSPPPVALMTSSAASSGRRRLLPGGAPPR